LGGEGWLVFGGVVGLVVLVGGIVEVVGYSLSYFERV
jgi:hypothetical protein